MKRCLCLLPLAGALAFAADLAGVHAVYLLPMSRGMDQFLANQLTNGRVFQVVTDPKLADAVLTDHLGEGFQAQLEEFSPTPKPPAPEKAAAAEPAAKLEDESPAPAKPAGTEPAAKPAASSKPSSLELALQPEDETTPAEKPVHPNAKAKPSDQPSSPGLMGKAENTLSNPAIASGFGRAHGTLFLVDAKSRQVIWSTYDPPRDFASKEMNRTASDIVSRLKHDLKPKK